MTTSCYNLQCRRSFWMQPFSWSSCCLHHRIYFVYCVWRRCAHNGCFHLRVSSSVNIQFMSCYQSNTSTRISEHSYRSRQGDLPPGNLPPSQEQQLPQLQSSAEEVLLPAAAQVQRNSHGAFLLSCPWGDRLHCTTLHSGWSGRDHWGARQQVVSLCYCIAVLP